MLIGPPEKGQGRQLFLSRKKKGNWEKVKKDARSSQVERGVKNARIISLVNRASFKKSG
jgi:hypothetical protein